MVSASEQVEQDGRLNWQTIAQLEPRLRLIERELLASPPPCSADLWPAYSYWKRRIESLAGWLRPDAHLVLGTSGAYELAISRILDILERPRQRREVRS